MAKEEPTNQLNLTVVALVALVAIVGLVALVMNAASIKNFPLATGSQSAIAAEENVAGDATLSFSRTCGQYIGQWRIFAVGSYVSVRGPDGTYLRLSPGQTIDGYVIQSTSGTCTLKWSAGTDGSTSGTVTGTGRVYVSLASQRETPPRQIMY